MGDVVGGRTGAGQVTTCDDDRASALDGRSPMADTLPLDAEASKPAPETGGNLAYDSRDPGRLGRALAGAGAATRQGSGLSDPAGPHRCGVPPRRPDRFRRPPGCRQDVEHSGPARLYR